MLDQFKNHIVGFPTWRLKFIIKYCQFKDDIQNGCDNAAGNIETHISNAERHLLKGTKDF